MLNRTTQLTFNDYRALIDSWRKVAQEEGILTSRGSQLPLGYWGTLLGITRKVHNDMYNLKHNTKGVIDGSKVVPEYYVKTIYYLSQLPKTRFLKELREHVRIYEENKQR